MKFLIFNFRFSKRGVSIYLALIIMFILLSIGLGVSLIIVSQAKMIREMENSVIAFHAADTGIEHSLYKTRKEGDPTGEIDPPEQVGDAYYKVKVAGENKWQAVGTFKGVKRAIEITIQVPVLVCQNILGGSCSGLSQIDCNSCSSAGCNWYIPVKKECLGPPNVCIGEEPATCLAVCGCTWDVLLGYCRGAVSCSSKDESFCSSCPYCSWDFPPPYCERTLDCSVVSEPGPCVSCSQCEWAPQ